MNKPGKKTIPANRKNGTTKTIPGIRYRNIVIVALVVVASCVLVYNLYIRKGEPQFVKQGEVTFMHSGSKAEIKKIDVEVASTPQTQTQGLMFRTHLEDTQGMLFLFPEATKHAFWMKNTLIPLDIIFIEPKGQIDTIYRNTTPLSERSLPSRKSIQFVVEVNGGFCDKNAIKEGDLINYQVLNK